MDSTVKYSLNARPNKSSNVILRRSGRDWYFCETLQSLRPFGMEQIAESFNLYYSKWNHIPWSFYTNPQLVHERLPTFVFGEFLFFLLSLVCFIHAVKKKNLFIWIATVIVGCTNDVIFMYLPAVDNFFHAQGTIMLTPRLPLYILCVYNSFMYLSTVSVIDLNLPIYGKAAIAGIIGELFYAPYDIIGAKYLWWTWHDSDLATGIKILGAPVGSSVWVITFCFSFVFLLSLTKSKLINFFLLLGFCTPLMVLQMSLFQIFGKPGIPDHNTLYFLLATYFLLIVFAINRVKTRKQPVRVKKTGFVDFFLFLAISVYFFGLSLIILHDPTAHVSTGIHQTIGDCNTIEYDLAGNARTKYFCPENFSEDFRIDCPPHSSYNSLRSLKNPDNTYSWYTVCGAPFSDYNNYAITIFVLCVVGIYVYLYFLTFPPGSTYSKPSSNAPVKGKQPATNQSGNKKGNQKPVAKNPAPQAAKKGNNKETKKNK